jgi:phosphoenolpyruvate carboxykinase (GTP)
VPLVTEAFDWAHGVFLGIERGLGRHRGARRTRSASLRRDPFAMLPFCGYNMGDYFGHWLKIGASVKAKALPKIFFVNWFRKDKNGKFLWPGFGENMRAS